MIKTAVRQGRSRRKHRRRTDSHPPSPSCQDSSVSVWLRWGRFRDENPAWCKARLGAKGGRV